MLVIGRLEFEPEVGSSLNKPCYLFVGRCIERARCILDENSGLEKHLFKSSRSDQDESPRRLFGLVAKPVQSVARKVDKVAWACCEGIVPGIERDLAFQYKEAFLLATVDVRRWAAAGTELGVPDGVSSVGVFVAG